MKKTSKITKTPLIIFAVVLIAGLLFFVLKSNLKITIGIEKPTDGSAVQQPVGPEEGKVVEKPMPIIGASFEKSIVYATGHIYSVAPADFNKDGYMDIAAVDFTRKNYLLINDGKGSFTPTQEFGSGNAKVIRAADFNNDGWPDLVVGKYGPESEVYINNQDGTYKKLILKEGLVEDLVVADFNSDGWMDIVAGVEGGQNYLYINNKDETFDAQPQFDKDMHVRALAACDFNNDGKLDLALGNDFQKNYLFLNNGDDTFEKVRSFGETHHTLSMSCADFDKDGKMDIAVGNDNQAANLDRNYIYYNLGDKTFSASDIIIGATRSYAIEAVDLNNDGLMDVVVGNYDRQSSVFTNLGKWQFNEINLPDEKSYVMDIASADMDGDGDKDLVFALEKEGVAIYENKLK